MDFEKKLNEILVESVSAAKERERETFDTLLNNQVYKFILWGCGDLGKQTLAGLRKLKIDVLCFVDNNKKFQETTIDGLKVFAPEQALELFPEATFILTIFSVHIGHPLAEAQKQLNTTTKVISFLYLYWKFPEIFLPFWRCDLPHKTIEQFELVSAALSLWSDDSSRQEYFGQVYWRISGDMSKTMSAVKQDQYFPDDIFLVNEKEVFVDIGAFDGDTLKVFLQKSSNNFRHYYAFEPDPFGCDKFVEFILKLSEEVREKISIDSIGIGSHNEKIEIESPGDFFKILFPEDPRVKAAKLGNDKILVESKPLDNIKFEHQPTFIKMDVEGFEPNVIFGAKELIKRYNPIIAIAIYHKFDHLWRLPLAINAMSKNYNFYLRPHYMAGWELVCYAVPKDRVINR